MSTVIRIELDAREVLTALSRTEYWPDSLDNYEATKDDHLVFFDGFLFDETNVEELERVELVVVEQ